MRKLKTTEVKPLRLKLMKAQKYICPLSLKLLTSTNACLDHSHQSGAVRAVLSRGANGAEGKILNLTKRFGACSNTMESIAFLRRLADYWELHRLPQTEYIHPSFGKPVKRKPRKRKLN